MKKLNKIFILLTTTILLLTGCGNSTSYSDTTMNSITSSTESTKGEINFDMTDDIAEEEISTTENESSTVTDSAKLIRKVQLNIETKTLDDIITNIKQKTSDLSGYIQTSESYNYSTRRTHYIVVRIPYEKVDSFLEGLDEYGTIRSISDNTEDITLQYAGIETRIKNLETQHSRLLTLLESSESLTDIIELEKRLSEVETELDSYKLEIKNYDNLVNYSTISIDIEETEYVSNIEDTTVWGRIKNGLSDNLYELKEGFLNIFIWFIIHIPNFIIWGIMIYIILLIIKRIRIKTKVKKQNNSQKKEL